jgi:hypothetical protein
MDERRLNYFNYNTEVEDTFVRRRGKHLFISNIDWALIETWKQMGVPLSVALRGIEKSFDSWEAKPRKRSVKTLLYCQEEVEAQYAEWLESRVGAGPSEGDGAEKPAEAPGLPFPRSDILAHLQRGRGRLVAARDERSKLGADEFCEALARAASLVEQLESDFAAVPRADAKKLEDSLTGIERLLSDVLRSTASPDQLEAIRGEIKSQLRPYRSQMDPAVYEQTFENLLLKRLREQFGVPRLSLFYL